MVDPVTGPRPSGPEIQRFALIIGAMKSGTTSLFQYLAAHPAVAPCRFKEPNFFLEPDRVAGGLEAYRGLWEWESGVHEVALEASTGYAKLPTSGQVAERIRATLPEVHFVYIMRDPIERIASHLTHTATARGGVEALGERDFEWALQVSRYATQLEPYARLWPRDRILPLLHERLRSDPAGTTRRTAAFLGLDPDRLDPMALRRTFNSRADFAAGHAVERVLGGDARLLAGIRRRTPESVARLARWLLSRRVTVHTVELSAARRARARAVLRPEVRRLREEWGVDPSPWPDFVDP